MAINIAYRPNPNDDVARWLFFANLSHSKLPRSTAAICPELQPMVAISHAVMELWSGM